MREVFGFSTMEARDAWINHLDPFSRATQTTNDNCFIRRIAIDSPRTIKRIENVRHYREVNRQLDLDDGIVKSYLKVA